MITNQILIGRISDSKKSTGHNDVLICTGNNDILLKVKKSPSRPNIYPRV